MRARTFIICKALWVVCLLFASSMGCVAQDDVEYRMEIGAAAGTSTYLGDFNGGIFKHMQPAGAVVFRVLNPRMAVRVTGMYTQLKGSADNATTVYPDLQNTGYSFNTSLVDLSGLFEYNFFPYGTGREYRGAKRLTPFVCIGIGFLYARASNGVFDYSSQYPAEKSKNIVSASIPMGLGVKYKVAPRLNLSLDWKIHFSLTDKLDGVKDPYRIASSGIFKNTDCYSTLMLALTYSFSPKCPTCHKDR